MMQMSQVLEYAHKTSHPQTRHLAEAITNRTLQAMPRSVCDAGSDDECLEGRCPRKEPRTFSSQEAVSRWGGGHPCRQCRSCADRRKKERGLLNFLQCAQERQWRHKCGSLLRWGYPFRLGLRCVRNE